MLNRPDRPNVEKAIEDVQLSRERARQHAETVTRASLKNVRGMCEFVRRWDQQRNDEPSTIKSAGVTVGRLLSRITDCRRFTSQETTLFVSGQLRQELEATLFEYHTQRQRGNPYFCTNTHPFLTAESVKYLTPLLHVSDVARIHRSNPALLARYAKEEPNLATLLVDIVDHPTTLNYLRSDLPDPESEAWRTAAALPELAALGHLGDISIQELYRRPLDAIANSPTLVGHEQPYTLLNDRLVTDMTDMHQQSRTPEEVFGEWLPRLRHIRRHWFDLLTAQSEQHDIKWEEMGNQAIVRLMTLAAYELDMEWWIQSDPRFESLRSMTGVSTVDFLTGNRDQEPQISAYVKAIIDTAVRHGAAREVAEVIQGKQCLAELNLQLGTHPTTPEHLTGVNYLDQQVHARFIEHARQRVQRDGTADRNELGIRRAGLASIIVRDVDQNGFITHVNLTVTSSALHESLADFTQLEHLSIRIRGAKFSMVSLSSFNHYPMSTLRVIELEAGFLPDNELPFR